MMGKREKGDGKMISYSNLLYFLELSDTLSFTKAARKLLISQQALSGTISAMEKELGVVLFQRTTPLQPTYAGRVLQKYAMQIRTIHTQMLQEMDDIRSEKSGEITVGISHTRGKNLLPHVLPLFQEAYPGIKVHLFEGNNDELAAAFSQGLIDLMIAQTPFSVRGAETVPLCREEVLLAVSDELLVQQFGGEKERVLERLSRSGHLSVLRDCPFLLNKPGNSLRTISEQIFAAEGFHPRTAIETENIETLYELCKVGAGCLFYPRMFLAGKPEYGREESLHFIPLSYEFARFTVGIGYREDAYFSGPMEKLIGIAAELFSPDRKGGGD